MPAEVDVFTLSAVIQWLATFAGAASWMVFVSLLVRSLMRADPATLGQAWGWIAAWLKRLSAPSLFFVVAFASFLVPLIATLVALLVPEATLEQLQPYYQQVIGWIAIFGAAWMGQQWLYHRVFKFPLPVFGLPDGFFEPVPETQPEDEREPAVG